MILYPKIQVSVFFWVSETFKRINIDLNLGEHTFLSRIFQHPTSTQMTWFMGISPWIHCGVKSSELIYCAWIVLEHRIISKSIRNRSTSIATKEGEKATGMIELLRRPTSAWWSSVADMDQSLSPNKPKTVDQRRRYPVPEFHGFPLPSLLPLLIPPPKTQATFPSPEHQSPQRIAVDRERFIGFRYANSDPSQAAARQAQACRSSSSFDGDSWRSSIL
jgi:hypothetical protein